MSTPTTHGSDVGYGSAQAIGLIANREIKTRITSKSFRVTTVVFMIAVVAGIVLSKLIGGDGPDFTVGVTGQTSAVATPLAETAKGLGQTIETKQVSTVDDGRQLVSDGKLDALLTEENGGLTVVVKKELDGKLAGAINALASQQALQKQITDLGGDPAKVAAAVGSAKAKVTPLQEPFPYDTTQLVIGLAAGILIYMSLMIIGQMIAQGVVEEKSSRVVELLLATVKPWQLMVGKVLGIGFVGLTQVLAVVIAGFVAGTATGQIPSLNAAAGSVIWLLVWFVIGMLIYGLLIAGVASLVSRQEEAGTVVMPVLMFLIVGYVVGISVVPSDPSNRLVEILSILPPFAPTLMPMRLALGGVPIWETILSLVLTLLTIPALTWLAARIYRNAIVRTGAKVKLRDALRQS